MQTSSAPTSSLQHPPTSRSAQQNDYTVPHQRYPKELEQKLDGVDLKLLNYIAYLCKLTARKSPSGAQYCYPCEDTLAARVGVRREAISRHVSKLASLGILKVVHRRKEHGTWRSNLYKIVSWEGWRLSRVAACIHRGINHVRRIAHKVPLERVNLKTQEVTHGNIGPTASEILKRWSARGQTSG
jgi:DNA-binding transcriptional ArsR family regulator